MTSSTMTHEEYCRYVLEHPEEYARKEEDRRGSTVWEVTVPNDVKPAFMALLRGFPGVHGHKTGEYRGGGGDVDSQDRRGA